MPESADGKNFSGSKVVCFTNVESVRNFVRVIFETKCLLEILRGCKIIRTVHWSLREKKISSAFRVQNLNLVVLLSVCKTY